MAKKGDFDFFEISIDETDDRLKRLDWTWSEKQFLVNLKHDFDLCVPTMCLSGHRKYPFGSHDPAIRQKAHDILKKAVDFALDTGIRNIQLAGYDVYYEEQDESTLENYTKGMQWAVEYAAAAQVMLSTEIMDTPFMSSITKWKKWDALIKSPWFAVYPDVGNLTAWNNDVLAELESGIDKIVAIHLKETLPVNDTFKGQFRDMHFGEGTVDFVSVFKQLKKLNYRGTFLIEMWGENLSDENALSSIIEAREFIEQKMDEAQFNK